tara:strand:+ start:258 stop:578 length:321 start_codon:yes stop_codon:yes gene_type:complete
MKAYGADGIERNIPTRKIVCPDCEGRGTDANHLGDISDEYLADAEWMQDYKAGHFDQLCPRCKGQNVVDDIDTDRCTPDQIAAYDYDRRIEFEDEQERIALRRIGA